MNKEKTIFFVLINNNEGAVEEKKFNVLIINDHEAASERTKILLENHDQIAVFQAFDDLSARIMLDLSALYTEKQHYFDIILLGDIIHENVDYSLPLLKKCILSGYKKPILATSNYKDDNKEFVENGATHLSSKANAHQDVFKLLKIDFDIEKIANIENELGHPDSLDALVKINLWKKKNTTK
jgi:hypothetical protein